ncbi:acyl carrier protein [Streptomyces sp. NBC_01304]|uniref:acyl carrier protein n=1 Tax=Streptomyces sp. NBC_01304 TaxID=2903818 RepID=UPI002E11417F|nr:acyl carrier protein [Streptomyces sp. NBC_01304]
MSEPIDLRHQIIDLRDRVRADDQLTLQIRALCADTLGLAVEHVPLWARLVADLEADSLDFSALADRLAMQYGIVADETVLREAETVRDLVALVLSAAPPAPR